MINSNRFNLRNRLSRLEFRGQEPESRIEDWLTLCLDPINVGHFGVTHSLRMRPVNSSRKNFPKQF
jgi:hypothetical protein